MIYVRTGKGKQSIFRYQIDLSTKLMLQIVSHTEVSQSDGLRIIQLNKDIYVAILGFFTT